MLLGFGKKVGIVTGGNAGAALLPRCQPVVATFFERVVQAMEKRQRLRSKNFVVALARRPQRRGCRRWGSMSIPLR
mgnify:CR=1 FL=1